MHRHLVTILVLETTKTWHSYIMTFPPALKTSAQEVTLISGFQGWYTANTSICQYNGGPIASTTEMRSDCQLRRDWINSSFKGVSNSNRKPESCSLQGIEHVPILKLLDRHIYSRLTVCVLPVTRNGMKQCIPVPV